MILPVYLLLNLRVATLGMIGKLKLRNMNDVPVEVGGSGAILKVWRLGRGDDDVLGEMDMWIQKNWNGGVDRMELELGNLVVQDQKMMIGVKEVVGVDVSP
jgi:hypothetical protein